MTKNWTILKIRDGKPVNGGNVRKLFDQLKDGDYNIDITRLDKRSNPQNRYYFGLVVPMIQSGIEHLGTELTKGETHEFLKSRFNVQEVTNTDTGEMVSIPKSTTRLSKEQFSEYIGKIQQFAAEFLNIVIPDPGVQQMINYDLEEK